jgi:hypothetical protein
MAGIHCRTHSICPWADASGQRRDARALRLVLTAGRGCRSQLRGCRGATSSRCGQRQRYWRPRPPPGAVPLGSSGGGGRSVHLHAATSSSATAVASVLSLMLSLIMYTIPPRVPCCMSQPCQLRVALMIGLYRCAHFNASSLPRYIQRSIVAHNSTGSCPLPPLHRMRPTRLWRTSWRRRHSRSPPIRVIVVGIVPETVVSGSHSEGEHPAE